MEYEIEFPAFDRTVQFPAGWTDESWHNDAMPCFTKGESSVLCNFLNPALREIGALHCAVTPWGQVDTAHIKDAIAIGELTTRSEWALAHTVAAEFCRLLHKYLGVKTMEQVAERNAAEPWHSNICHTHDFCDANQVMIDALESVGIGFSIDDDEVLRVTNAAWSLANVHSFTAEGVQRNLKKTGK